MAMLHTERGLRGRPAVTLMPSVFHAVNVGAWRRPHRLHFPPINSVYGGPLVFVKRPQSDIGHGYLIMRDGKGVEVHAGLCACGTLCRNTGKGLGLERAVPSPDPLRWGNGAKPSYCTQSAMQ